MKFRMCQLNLRFSDTTEYRTAVGHEFLVTKYLRITIQQ